MRGHYAYKNRLFKTALRFLEPVWQRPDHDAAMAAYFVGLIWSKESRRQRDAEEALRESLKLEEQSGNIFGQAQVWHGLGNLFSRNQRDKEAEKAYRKSLELEERNGNIFGQAQVWHSWANLLSKNKKRWPEAEELYQKSYEFLRKSGDRRGIIMVARSYGLLALDKGDYDQAEKYLRIAFENERNEFYRNTIAVKLEEVARKKVGR